MFTGIIEEVGEIGAIDDKSEFRTIHVRTKRILDDAGLGSSIAVNGVCLTVRSLERATFTAELPREPREHTTLGDLRRSALVNLERPRRADGRFGGHMVQG